MKTYRGRSEKKSKELICFTVIKVILMLEMLRNWREPAMSALLIYQIIKPGIFTLAKILSHKNRSGNRAFLLHKGKLLQGTCMASVESTIVSKCIQYFVSVLKEVDPSRL